MTSRRGRALLLLLGSAALFAAPQGASGQQQQQWKHFPAVPQAPAGAPNVLLIMTDDVGFGASSTFGGAVPTPTFDALARAGLRYNRFHTVSMCSPTRAALLTGRNHHAVTTGALTDLAVDEAGYTATIPKSAGTIAQVLRVNGYDTSFYGKNHNTPAWEAGPLGPFDRWPNGFGFDYFYGFNAAVADQFRPLLIENRNPIDPPKTPGYHLDTDLSDHLIHWLQIQHNLRPDHPFFAYLAPGTVHSPHQAPPEWVARFKGKFDSGWDVLRQQTFERQKRMGIIPADAVLTPRPDILPAWDSIGPELKKVYAHQMEIAAAQLAHSDYEIGRVIDELKRSGQYENTLIVFLEGDNGASWEGYHGSLNEAASLAGIETTDEDMLHPDKEDGGPDSFSNYHAAWGWATNTPYQWGKQDASHLGGLRDGLVVCWPRRIHGGGQIRSQFTHVIDVAPTIYEAAGIALPARIDGVEQQPIDGISFVYSFDNPAAPSRHRRQYFEMLGNRSMYLDGWMASTVPARPPWSRSFEPIDVEHMTWQLYHVDADYSQSKDLAARYPAKLAELKRAFDEDARRYNVYPLASNVMLRLNPANRPSLTLGRKAFSYFPGETRYAGGTFVPLERGGRFTAMLDVTAPGASGTAYVQGDVVGGMGLVLEAGRPRFVYNPGGRPQERLILEGAALAPGRHEVAVVVTADPAGGERAARIALVVDGTIAASARAPVYYIARGEGYVGRPGVRHLLPGGEDRRPDGFALERLDVLRP